MSDTGFDPLKDYRSSHRQAGYGQHYARTYQRGYYAELWNKIERPLLERRLDEAIAAGATRALDFACGTGRVTQVLEGRFGCVLGVDVSESMLEVARERLKGAEVRLLDITQTPLVERFDVATAFRFFLNAETSLRVAALDALREAIVSGGRLIANVHVTATSPLGLAYRARNAIKGAVVAKFLSVDELVDTASTAGFDLLSVDRYGFLPRVGGITDGRLLAAMAPVEKILGNYSRFTGSLAQAALLVFGRR